MTYLGAALKRRLYPTVLCYHGCVARRADVLTFRESLADVRAHVRTLQQAGYRIVKPSEYKAWQDGSASFDQPVTCLHFDDGLASIDLVVPWLIEQGLPCGLALITRRLGHVDPEPDFVSWAQLNVWVASGLVELLNHTHNLHHLTLVRTGGVLDVAPVLEGPCWVDDGDVVYRLAGDPRWYWDFSQLDEVALAIPLWGTDQYDGATPLQTTLTLTPKATGSVSVLRFWMALSRPFGGGYDAEVEIRAGGVLVWAGTIAPKVYSTRAQWVEREFFSIELDTAFAVVSGTPIELEFTTLNAGSALALVYALPGFDDADFNAVTNCQGLYAAGTAGDRQWQYIDYPPGERWPLAACLILAFGTGADATVPQYEAYVDADCAAFDNAVANWLTADWVPTDVWTTPSRVGPPNVIGWSNPTLQHTVIPIVSATTRTIEALRFLLGGTENFQGGDADDELYDDHPNVQAAIAEALGRSYTATFRLSIGDTATGPWTEIGRGQVYNWQRGRASDVQAFVLTGGVTRYLYIETLNGGWLSGGEQRCRWPVWTVTALSRVSGAPAADPVSQIVYPFGSYFASGGGVVQQRPGFKDIGPELKGVLQARDYTHGYTIQAYRNTAAAEFREPDLRQTEWALGRWIVYGDQAPEVSRNNLAALSGMLFQDVPHRGVQWQASLEADPQGNASVRARADVLDFVAFDAWGFDGAGGIEPFAINDGGTYDGEVYADDKGWLQARGVRCLLIINNNLGTGEPDADIASHVVNHPATYIPLIVAIAVDDGWDGITCNLEAVPAADRAAATSFYEQLARAMHDEGKLLHATVPAATGTAYDAEFWTGWCDHFALAKVCDAIKVMSYTESGPGTNPGPAAPQAFWDLVYARMRSVVAEPWWPRVLVGCRAFGHVWNLTDATTEYATYHQAIAQGLEFAKRIDTRDTELGWGTDSIKAWCGTPATVDRAQREAAASFGGIGLWKLDDGDIEEFIPPVRQITRDEDMSFLDVRVPDTISRGSTGGPEFATGVAESQSGDEARNGRRLLPLCRYDVAVGVRDQDQADQLRDLFMVARGRLNLFRYRDWQDYRLVDGVIGTSDGVITTFQLVKVYEVDAYSLTRPITLPVDGTLDVKRNGVSVGGWTCNYSTGLVSFASPPAAGVISASCEFDVKARFDIDYLPTEIVGRNPGTRLFRPGSIPLVERRA
jgi:uncharacterized protein (TIGR02217 family)